MAISLNVKRVWRGDGGGGEHKLADRVVGEGPGFLLERNQEGIRRKLFQGRQGEVVGVELEGVGKVMRRELQTGTK